MHFFLANKLSNSNKVLKKENEITKNTKTKEVYSNANTLSFMSIPATAFMGNLIVPVMPVFNKQKGHKLLNLKEPLTLVNDKLTTSYSVYPQDPLVSSLQTYTLTGEVKPGPENNRIKVVDQSKLATPDTKGHYKPDINSPQFDRVNAFVFANKAIDLYEKALGRKLSWAFEDKQVKIFPRAGVKANAYYNRWDAEIKLFHYQNRFKQEETCYTSKMADIIAHETGHAIMDGLRPTYATWGYYGGSIHEGFGDITAMLVALNNDKIIDKVIEQTGGDLKKENMVASLAEQFGNSLRKDRAMFLRNAINNMKLSDFETGKAEKEVHVLGRLVDAVFYDMYVAITTEYNKTMPLKEAMIAAKNDTTRLHARAIADFMPVANVYLEDLAKAYLKSDNVDFGGKYAELLKEVFLKREILDNTKINGWENELNNLPLLQIKPADMLNSSTIENFVNKNTNKFGVPIGNYYQVETAYNNIDGETFIHLKAPREIELPVFDITNNKPYGIEVYDVMSLGFNKDGHLFYKSIKNTKRRGAATAIKEATEALKVLKIDQNNLISSPGLSSVYRKSGNSSILIKPPKF